jgi:hypothetical protein
MLLGKVDTQAACDVRLEDFLQALRVVSVQQPTIGATSASTAPASSNDGPDVAASSDGCRNKLDIDEAVMDYDDMKVTFALVNPKLDRLLNAVQKGCAPVGEKRDCSVDPISA